MNKRFQRLTASEAADLVPEIADNHCIVEGKTFIVDTSKYPCNGFWEEDEDNEWFFDIVDELQNEIEDLKERLKAFEI